MTIAISFGRWGGVYAEWGYSKRLCLGWVAITFFPVDLDPILNALGSNCTSNTSQPESTPENG